MVASLRKDKKAASLGVLFLAFAGWWLSIQLGQAHEQQGQILDWFAGTYGVIALLGGTAGIIISRQWGGWNSMIGRSIMMFSIGLLLQEFGQLVYAYYAIVKEVEVPYPSIGDVGFFGSVIFYIYGAFLLAHASGAAVTIRNLGNKILALLVPVLLLGTSYWLFLKGYEFDWSNALTVILDFGYPLGQAVYIAIALLAFLLSYKLLGGLMRNKILFIIFALVAQYVADFNFLFQVSRETWNTAGYGDLLYMTSYTLMALALLNISATTLRSGKTTKPNNDNGSIE
jgi:hypothetical protein